LFKLLHKYRPETEQQKAERLKKAAAEKDAKKETKHKAIKFGINNVTTLIEKKKAKLVIIAHDVDPIELVVWLPTLCRRMEVPYCIVKSKSRLGALVHQKTATALALVDVNKEDVNELTHLATTCNDTFNNNADLRKLWGGGQLSNRSNASLRKRERAIAREAAAKTKAQ
jgi:large subunit ribosomal protein L7Ae